MPSGRKPSSIASEYTPAMSERVPNQWDVWEETIRKPADQAAEGKRRIDCGSATAEYQLAHLPDGRWAVRMKCNLEFVTGTSIPWRSFATREEAVAFFQQQA